MGTPADAILEAMLSWYRGESLNRTGIYLANLLVSFHYFLTIFVNSTYLIQYVNAEQLSLLYILGSAFSVGLFSVFTPIIRRVGNYRAAIGFVVLEGLSLLGMGFGHDVAIITLSFLLYLAVSPIIYLNLDIFLEKSVKNEKVTGGVRGTFLLMQNITQVVCPFLVAFLLVQNEYWRVYAVSLAFLLIALAVIITRLYTFDDARYRSRKLWQSAAYVLRHPALYDVTMAQSLLRFFYAWMVIYTPLYLYQYVGFSWEQIGVLFAIMLLPFLLLELPLGRLADGKLPERTVMIFGFIVMAITVAVIPFLTAPTFAVWAVVLFISRIGASCTEIATESYFFRHVDGALADTISLFRVARPVTYIAAAVVASLALQVISLQWSFLILAVVMAWGLRYALALRNAR